MQEPAFVWALSNHVHAQCFGRLIERLGDDGGRVFRCSNCGDEAEAAFGDAHPPNCACGMKVGARAVGVRCVVNTERRPGFVCEIVAREAA
jgi:hypothetical protein